MELEKEDPTYLRYDKVEWVDQLPRPMDWGNSGDRVTGCAVHGGGPDLPELGWLFFSSVEVGLIFGRTARMGPWSGYRVVPASSERKFSDREQHDIRVLRLLKGSSLDRKDDEIVAFERWIEGIRQNPPSSGWMPPATSATAGREKVAASKPARTKSSARPGGADVSTRTD